MKEELDVCPPMLIPSISWGIFPLESQIPTRKSPKKNNKKCIKFTPPDVMLC